MADHKAKSQTFKVPEGTNLGEIKMAIENENTNNVITLFQEIGANEYLVELTDATHVQEMYENGFDAGHVYNWSYYVPVPLELLRFTIFI